MKPNQQHIFKRKALLGYFLAVIFAFLFAYNTGSKLITNAAANTKHQGFLFNNGNLADSEHQPLDIPEDSDPNPQESEGTGENESKDSSDDDEVSKLCCRSLDKRLTLVCQQSLLLQGVLSTDARSKISLFILHHSWKSFLI